MEADDSELIAAHSPRKDLNLASAAAKEATFSLQNAGASSADDIAHAWIGRLNAAVDSGSGNDFAALFQEDGHWRDILSFTWARGTFSGRAQIQQGFDRTVAGAGAGNFRFAEKRVAPRLVRRSGRDVVEIWFDFDLNVGKGTGFVRLALNAEQPLQSPVWLLLTTLYSIDGGEEKVGDKRPTGDEYSKLHSTENWAQKRSKEQLFEDRDPKVIIIGAGQSGLMLGARLRQMGIDALIVDRVARVGDNWRARYNNLTIHNEITANNFPYLDFPATWPTWLPKDMVADWLEAYAKFLELNVWTSTEVLSANYDRGSACWSIKLRRADGSERVMSVPHLVAAMGVSGGVAKRPKLPGADEFGGQIIHSADFTTGAEWAGKNAIVVGTGNSGHDIAQDLHVSGAASVSLLQRGETCVISLDPCARISYGIYNEGVASEDIDLMTAAIPYPILIDTYQHITKRTCEIDRDLLEGLERAGFRTHLGEDETGFQLLYLRGAGGYYIDVGCSQLIIDKKIGMIQWEDCDRLVEGGMLMKDGHIVPADLVVLATGFESMQEGIRRMLGDEIADRVGPVWGFDEKHEMRNMWTRTAQDGLWIMGGSIVEARLNSRFLALQIKASLEGLIPARAAMPLAVSGAARA